MKGQPELYTFPVLRRNAAFQLDRLAFLALLLAAFSFAFEVLHPLVTLAGWQFSNAEALQWLVIGLCLAARLLDLQWRVPGRGLTVSIVLWLVVLGASTLLNYQFSSLVFDMRLVRGVLLAWAAYDLARAVTRWRRLIYAFCLGGIVIYAVGLLEAANVPGVTSWLNEMRGASMHVGDLLRISSTLPYPTIATMCIELTLIPLLGWFLTAIRPLPRFVLGIGLLSGLVALILTFTRGGLLALGGGFAVMAGSTLLLRRYRRLIALSGAAILGGLLILISLFIVLKPALALRFISENSEAWYRAEYQVPPRLSAQPGALLRIPVNVTNSGLHAWQSGGVEPFHLSYHLIRVYPNLRLGILFDGQRAELPHDIPPGESITLSASVPTPPEPGEYLIRWDMLQESVTWFSQQNAATGETHLTLSGPPLSESGPFPRESFDDLPNQPTVTRLMLWRAALAMTADTPLLGVGPDNFRFRYGAYAGLPNTNMHANNLYLELLADTGIAGLLSFLWFSGRLLSTAIRSLREKRSDADWLLQLALIGGLTTWYLHGLVDYFFEFTPPGTAFWLVAGLALAYRSREPVEPPR